MDEAIACRQKLLVLQRNHVQAHNNLGVAIAQKDEPAEAIRYLERALTLKPDYAEANFNLANVLCNQKSRDNDRRPEGIEHYREAIRIRPNYIEPIFNLGSVLTDLNRLAEDAIWLRQAVRLGGTRTVSGGNGQQAEGGVAVHAGPHPLTASVFNQLGLAAFAYRRNTPRRRMRIAGHWR